MNPEPVASAAPVSAPATTVASAAPSASAAVPAAVAVTKVKLSSSKAEVEYVQIKHPNAHAVDVINRLLKKEAETKASEMAGRAQPNIHEYDLCDGGFPTEDTLWVRCNTGAAYEGRSAPYVYAKTRVWSLAGKEPSRLELTAQLTGNWTAPALASCVPQLRTSTPVEEIDRSSLAEELRKDQSWWPQKEGLLLAFPQGTLGPLGDGIPECTIPWDKLAPFLQPSSPLRPLADKAPPSPPPPPLENASPRSLVEDPGRQPQNLPPPFDAHQVACNGGDKRACVKVGEALYAGKEVSEDSALAAWIFQNTCEAGEPTGCVNLGWVFLNGTSAEPGALAAPFFGKACTDKVTLGCLGLGTIYRDGRDTPKNPARAAELFKRACDGGVKAACPLTKATKP